ncbi:unnamed protein product, partial [Rotaria sp. Silwood1]
PKLEDHKSIPSEIKFEIPYIFSIEFVWETIQQVLSDVLSEYIDFDNVLEPLSSDSSSTLHSTDYTDRPSLIDFSHYLTKKSSSTFTAYSTTF